MSNESMEYAGNLPVPTSQVTKMADPNTTLWVTQTGDFLYLPTEAQAKIKAKAIMDSIVPEEWWAQKVSKFSVGEKDYLCAYIKRDFSEKHDRTDFSNASEDEMWIGREVIGLPLMATDTRERSRTAGKRVKQTIQAQLPDGTVQELPVLGTKGFYSYHEDIKANHEFYKKMCGSAGDGRQTVFMYILLDGGRNVSEDNPGSFWLTDTKSALRWDRNQLKEEKATARGQEVRPSNLK
jgi:hypothetical protein